MAVYATSKSGFKFSPKKNSMANKEKKPAPVALKVFEEHAQIDKKIVTKGKVNIVKKVHTHDENIQVTLDSENVKIEKVTINEYVNEAPQVRYEGNTTIIPVVKEVAVVEKRILLVEEIHVTRQVTTSKEEKIIPLRKEEISIETSGSDL